MSGGCFPLIFLSHSLFYITARVIIFPAISLKLTNCPPGSPGAFNLTAHEIHEYPVQSGNCRWLILMHRYTGIPLFYRFQISHSRTEQRMRVRKMIKENALISLRLFF
jgi:hypothetical protein